MAVTKEEKAKLIKEFGKNEKIVVQLKYKLLFLHMKLMI